jgi:nucleotide-binding universal stress UspA family protein
MFSHLLVPLDGSRLAEGSLVVASMLCQKLNAVATLIHIIEEDAPQEIHGERHLTDEEEACRYLDEIAQKYFLPDAATCHVHAEKVQDVAQSISDHSGELAPDLIVMCTHGKSGLRDIMVGSIAQQIIGMGKTPILLVNPQEGNSEPTQITKILVALDGDPAHDASLPVAAELAQKLGAVLHLLTVVHTLGTLPGERAATGWLLPGATRAMLDMDEEAAHEHLQKLAVQWRKTGLSVTTEVLRGDPAQQILANTDAVGADLIALATHGKSGMSAFWSSSVGPRVVSASKTPLLLIPVKK